jgi:lipid-A-disaccharide synthase
MNQIMIVAAESSSVHYAQRLLEFWKKQNVPIQAFGVGSREMEKMGFECLGRAEEMAVVGAAEIISQYKHLKSVFDRLVAEAEIRRPQVAIVMDYPEFNLMLSKKLKALGIPVVYYISPQVWAWRQGRVKTIKKYCEKVFLLFPFERPFYDRHQVKNEFIGHPILDDLRPELLDPEWLNTQRGRVGFKREDIVLGLMPGSRRGEIAQHFAIQLQVARNLAQRIPQLKILILVAPTFDKAQLEPYLEDFKTPYLMIKKDPFDMIALTDYMIVASGTATLMVGLLQKPMVIMYKMKTLTSWFAKIFVRGTKYFGLVNLILDEEVCPERFQEKANPEHLSKLLEELILDQKKSSQMRSRLAELKNHLGQRGATERVAKSLQEYLK